MNIIDSIKKIRKYKGISQEYIASHLNISQSAYHKIEASETELTTDRLQHILKVLEIDLAELIDKAYSNDIGVRKPYCRQECEMMRQLVMLYERRLKDKNTLINFLQQELKKEIVFYCSISWYKHEYRSS